MCTQGVSLGLQGMGAVTSAVGAYSSAKAQKSALRGQAVIDDINARQSETAYQVAMLSGQREVQKVQAGAAQLKGRQRAALAANGVDLGTGSAAEVLTSTDVMSEIDENTLAANAVRAAWGYKIQKTGFENDALFKRAGASAISPFGAMTTSLMGSAGAVAKSWYDYTKNEPATPTRMRDGSAPKMPTLGQPGY